MVFLTSISTNAGIVPSGTPSISFPLHHSRHQSYKPIMNGKKAIPVAGHGGTGL
jgi:hypothetical protein